MTYHRTETIFFMSKRILTTKLYLPPPGPGVLLRPRLIKHLDDGLNDKLTLIIAPAGYGKTTLIGEWVSGCKTPVAMLCLDGGDNDTTRFLTYFIAALQKISTDIGNGISDLLQSPGRPAIESILSSLINDIVATSKNFTIVLDDYHLVDSDPVNGVVSFLLDHLPHNMRMLIATREEPRLNLAQLRARGQLTEIRSSDLRFTRSEAALFFNTMMGLNLSAKDIDLLENRTEGWIAGLKLTAISLRGNRDVEGFIRSFRGSHRFIADYLAEEVLSKQPEEIRTFLLRTSILNRLCGPLCDAVVMEPSINGQRTLEYLEQANLFLVPMDNERIWYRYHHLFGEWLLRMMRNRSSRSSLIGETDISELHIRASGWYEENGLEIEAFQHAVAANDLDRATRLVTGRGMPLHVRGGLLPVLNWLESLPVEELNKRPILWVMFAGALTTAGQTADVEAKLKAAENALNNAPMNDQTRDLIGRIANNRAILAVSQYNEDTIFTEANRALEYLHRDNLPVRAITIYALGVALELKGNRHEAEKTFREAIDLSKTIGHSFVTKLATIALGHVEESQNMLYQAEETYREALRLFGDHPLPIACEAHLGLARIYYQWNDLDSAFFHGEESLKLAKQFAKIIDRFVLSEVFLARLKLARGDIKEADAILTETSKTVRRQNFQFTLPEVTDAQITLYLRQGNLKAADHPVRSQPAIRPLSKARVFLAMGDTVSALKVLDERRQEAEKKGWEDEKLKAMLLQAIAMQKHGNMDEAIRVLTDALTLAEPAGFIRIFADEGLAMDQLLAEIVARGIFLDYSTKLSAVIQEEERKRKIDSPPSSKSGALIEPLSERELQILKLIAMGLSNREIGEKLSLALDTVKGHNRNIFGKLGAQRRTEAVAYARDLGLL